MIILYNGEKEEEECDGGNFLLQPYLNRICSISCMIVFLSSKEDGRKLLTDLLLGKVGCLFMCGWSFDQKRL